MPKKVNKKRGAVKKGKTIRLDNGKQIRVAIVKKTDPRGPRG